MPTKTEKKTGVWVNGKLVFANRDINIAEGYAQLKMREFANNVWLAPVGSFVTA